MIVLGEMTCRLLGGSLALDLGSMMWVAKFLFFGILYSGGF